MARTSQRSTPSSWSRATNVLRTGLSAVRRGGWSLAAIYVVSQVAVAVAVVPILRWLASEALAAAGLPGLDFTQVGRILGTPTSLWLFGAVFAVAFLVLLVQFFVLLAATQRVVAGTPLTWRGVLGDLRATMPLLARPSALVLIPHLFFLVPLTGFGFLSVITQAISIPPFISGELWKSAPTTIGLVTFVVLLCFFLTRQMLTIPIMHAQHLPATVALRRSWTATKPFALLAPLAVVVAVAVGSLVTVVLAWICTLPTMLTDALWPAASPVVASISLAIGVTAGIVIAGFGVALVAAMLVQMAQPARPAQEAEGAPESASVTDGAERAAPPSVDRRSTLTAVSVLSAVAVAVAIGTIPVMNDLVDHPHTLVLGHRGDISGGVENTFASLDASRANDLDLVEMDVMQTKDGGYVVMHDAMLSRLADADIAIASMTFDEATSTTVHDQRGNTGVIPSFDDYLARADEIGQKLLIEIKLNGAETEDHVEGLIAIMEEHGSLDDHIYHSLDEASVDTLKRLRPGLNVGLTMAFAGLGIPDTSADFIVVEEWSYSRAIRDEAREKGLGIFTWSVNNEEHIREMLRDDIDGIITDKGAFTVAARAEMQQQQGLAGILQDALARFVTLF